MSTILPSPCWCNATEVSSFDDHYVSCRRCGTLRVRHMPTAEQLEVGADEIGIYGRAYWFEHQREMGLPDIEARRLLDVPERFLHWLRALLRRRPPPARVLEIGCGHGGFVATMCAAGYDAQGLELSPWVVDYTRRTFGVAVDRGPVEAQDWPSGHFDVIVMMDVLEHLPRPLATLARCAELLTADGLLLIQTPERPANGDRSRLARAGDRFLEMLLPEEHLFLFSRASVTGLCERVGLDSVGFLEALFGYDMFFVAGRGALPAESTLAHGLNRLRGDTAWLVRCALELDERRRGEHAAYEVAERDLGARTRQLERTEEALAQADTDRRERLRRVEELEQSYVEADADRRERLRQVEELEQSYQEADADRRQRARQVERLANIVRGLEHERAEDRPRREQDRRRLRDLRQRLAVATDKAATEVDAREGVERIVDKLRAQSRADRLEIERLGVENETLLDQARAAALRTAEVEERLADGIARAAASIETLATSCGRLAVEKDRAVFEAKAWRRHLDSLRRVDEDHRTSRIYRLLVALGRWRAHDARLARVLDSTTAIPTPPSAEPFAWRAPAMDMGESRRGPILVDLTALLPGGTNGGIKRLALELISALAELEPERAILLLATSACPQELAYLETSLVRCHQVRPDHPDDFSDLVDTARPSVLFCPTTAPPFDDPRVPLVSLVPDLQDRVYPQFFSAHERGLRDANVQRAVRGAHRLVAISRYVGSTLIETAGAVPEQVETIPIALANRLGTPTETAIDRVLARHGLEARGYLLYPANFWPHKNHAMLLTSMGVLHRRHVPLKLVLTGAGEPDSAPVEDAARRMGLGDVVVFAGFVTDEDLAALLAGCRALIFPSLYEGFGMPVLEALWMGRPVLASRVTALPEVAEDAALYFDPRRPDSIVEAVETLLADGDLEDRLIEKGRRRARALGDRRTMARRYLEVLNDAAHQGPREGLFGFFADGWMRPRAGVIWGDGDDPEAERTLEIEVSAPPVPDSFGVVLRTGGQRHHLELFPRQAMTLRCALPASRGTLHIVAPDPWIPAAIGLNDDPRRLGLQLGTCRLVEAETSRTLELHP